MFNIENIKIIRVSETKIRIKYKISILYLIDNEDFKLSKYHNISIVTRNLKKSDKNYSTPLDNNFYICSKPFENYFNIISQYYGIPKKYLNIVLFNYETLFEDKKITFKIPNYLYFKGNGVKEKMRVHKIKTLLKNVN
jgi:hypothetical protein